MKKGMCKWALLCLAAAVLGGCGSEGDGVGEAKLEDIRSSLSDGQQEAAEQDSRTSEEAGESAAGTPESGEAGQDDVEGKSKTERILSPEEEAMYEAYVKALEDI